MPHQHILIFTIIISIVGFHIASGIENTINQDTLNYGIYSNSNCSNPVAFGSVDYYLDNNQSAQYKTIFNGDEYYYLYKETGNIYLNITSSNTTSNYGIPTNQTCVKGINGYYYQFNQRTGRIGANGYYPTLVYFGIQSSLCGAISIMVSVPNNAIPSLLGFVDIKYPLLNIGKSILNGTTFNCGECGDGRCMDTYQFVNYDSYEVDIQFDPISNFLIVKGTGCKSFLFHTLSYKKLFTDFYSQLECNSVWAFGKILPEDLFIESSWNSSNEFFPINSKTIQNKYVVPKLMYLTSTTNSKVSFKVNDSFGCSNVSGLMASYSYQGYPMSEVDPLYTTIDSYNNQYSYYKGRFAFGYPTVLKVLTFLGSEYTFCAAPYAGPTNISVIPKTTSIVLSSPYAFLSISIGDRFVYCGHGFSVTIDSLKPNTKYNIRAAQMTPWQGNSVCIFQTIGYLNVTTESGLTTPLINSYIYENGNITLTYNSTTGYGSIKYSVSMNNRFIPTCYQTQYTNCTFTPISPLQVNQQYKLRVVAYIDGETKSTTYSFILNQSNHLELQIRPPFPPILQPTLPPALPPTTTPPSYNTTINDTIMNMDSSHSVSINYFNEINTTLTIMLLLFLQLFYL